MRKKQAWLNVGRERTSSTKPMRPQTRERRDRKRSAIANRKSPIQDRETGTIRYPALHASDR